MHERKARLTGQFQDKVDAGGEAVSHWFQSSLLRQGLHNGAEAGAIVQLALCA